MKRNISLLLLALIILTSSSLLSGCATGHKWRNSEGIYLNRSWPHKNHSSLTFKVNNQTSYVIMADLDGISFCDIHGKVFDQVNPRSSVNMTIDRTYENAEVTLVVWLKDHPEDLGYKEEFIRFTIPGLFSLPEGSEVVIDEAMVWGRAKREVVVYNPNPIPIRASDNRGNIFTVEAYSHISHYVVEGPYNLSYVPALEMIKTTPPPKDWRRKDFPLTRSCEEWFQGKRVGLVVNIDNFPKSWLNPRKYK